MGLLARLKTKNRSAWSTLFLPNVHLLDKKSGNLSQNEYLQRVSEPMHIFITGIWINTMPATCSMALFFIAEEDFNHVKLVKILLWGTNALDLVNTN